MDPNAYFFSRMFSGRSVPTRPMRTIRLPWRISPHCCPGTHLRCIAAVLYGARDGLTLRLRVELIEHGGINRVDA